MQKQRVLNQLQRMKTDDSILNAASMWFSANMVIASYALGALGPMVFGLNFGQSVLVIIFFNIMGLIFVAFFSVFGAELGLRQMILSRYLVGNVTARIFSLINVIACVGWGIVNTSVSAQLLNMVNEGSGHNCPIWAGCLIIIGGTVLVTFFWLQCHSCIREMVMGTQFCRLFGYYCPTIEIRKV